MKLFLEQRCWMPMKRTELVGRHLCGLPTKVISQEVKLLLDHGADIQCMERLMRAARLLVEALPGEGR